MMKSDKKMAILITAIMMISIVTVFAVPASAVIPASSIEVNKTVLDSETGEWVKSLNANINDTIRFKCNISYYSFAVNNFEVADDGFGVQFIDGGFIDRRFWDILDCSLEFAGNATLNGENYTELCGEFVFKPKVLHPDNLSWDPYNPQLGNEWFDELCPKEGNSYSIDNWEDTDSCVFG